MKPTTRKRNRPGERIEEPTMEVPRVCICKPIPVATFRWQELAQLTQVHSARCPKPVEILDRVAYAARHERIVIGQVDTLRAVAA